MNHPEKEIRLDKVFETAAKERWLAVGDRCRFIQNGPQGEVHRICSVGQRVGRRGTVGGVNETAAAIWASEPTLVQDFDSIAEAEAQELFGEICDWLHQYARIDPDGRETPLSTIYAEPEKIEVGVGSWLDWEGKSLILLVRNRQGGVSYVVFADGETYLGGGSIMVADLENLTQEECVKLFSYPAKTFTLLNPRTAYAKLSERGQS